jgi:hypothetical protein
MRCATLLAMMASALLAVFILPVIAANSQQELMEPLVHHYRNLQGMMNPLLMHINACISSRLSCVREIRADLRALRMREHSLRDRSLAMQDQA